jgi:integrase
MHCPESPACEHHWYYDFRVNRARYRATTETSNKQEAKQIEALERSKILGARHGIRKLPDITFRAFADSYVKNYAEPNKRDKGARDREILKVLNRAFGSARLHEITGLRIEQFKRERLAGKWRGNGQKTTRPIRPATVNRELNTLRSIFTKAIEWKKLVEHPMAEVHKLKVDNRRTRILSEAEQAALLAACRPKFRRLVQLALITGARIGELLALTWAEVSDTDLRFPETKNGKARRIPLSQSIRAVLADCPRMKAQPWVFTSTRTRRAYTVRGVTHIFRRAVKRAGLTPGDVTLHTLRHTALSRMIAAGIDDYTVMEISGHSSTTMLARYTHPTAARKVEALDTFRLPDGWAESGQNDQKGRDRAA